MNEEQIIFNYGRFPKVNDSVFSVNDQRLITEIILNFHLLGYTDVSDLRDLAMKDIKDIQIVKMLNPYLFKFDNYLITDYLLHYFKIKGSKECFLDLLAFYQYIKEILMENADGLDPTDSFGIDDTLGDIATIKMDSLIRPFFFSDDYDFVYLWWLFVGFVKRNKRNVQIRERISQQFYSENKTVRNTATLYINVSKDPYYLPLFVESLENNGADISKGQREALTSMLRSIKGV